MTQQNQFGQPLGLPVTNWTSRPKPAKKSMKGYYCILEPLDIMAHASNLFEALKFNNAGETWTYLPSARLKPIKISISG